MKKHIHTLIITPSLAFSLAVLTSCSQGQGQDQGQSQVKKQSRTPTSRGKELGAFECACSRKSQEMDVEVYKQLSKEIDNGSIKTQLQLGLRNSALTHIGSAYYKQRTDCNDQIEKLLDQMQHEFPKDEDQRLVRHIAEEIYEQCEAALHKEYANTKSSSADLLDRVPPAP